MDAAHGTGAKGPLDRFLNLFTDVRAGEGVGAVLLASTLFLLLGSYYLLKTTREALILAEEGAAVKSYASAGQALLLLLVIPAYGWFSSRVSRAKMLGWTTAFFISHLVLFYLIGVSGVQVGVAFYIWLGIFNVFVVALYWGLANDVYSEIQGKRLFPIVGVGASAGAWVGSRFAGELFDRSGAYGVMAVAALILLLCIALGLFINHREGVSGQKKREEKVKPLGREGGFRLVLSSRYLLLIAMMLVILNMVNTIGEYILGSLVVDYANSIVASGAAAGRTLKEVIANTYGDFFSWVNLLGLLFQLFLVSRIFKYIGVRGALFILPLIALGSYGLIAAIPLLSFVRVGKILENGTDYSIQNTARHGLFLVTSREAKYKAQAAIETFFWRIGDLLQAGIVALGTQVFLLSVRGFALVNVGMILVWLAVVTGIYREHKRLSREKEEVPKAA
jgi:AAA family ATP:ADP antiporter